MRLLIFGDSITQGFWDADGGWVARLRRTYDELKLTGQHDDPPTVFNLGVSGDDSGDIVARCEHEIKVRDRYGDLAIIFATGVNDSYLESGRPVCELAEYRRNLATLLAQAQQYTSRVMFVGLTPCVESRTRPVAWNDTVQYVQKRIDEFDQTLREFCQERGEYFVDVLPTFQQRQQKTELLPDGVHPNGAGHQLLAELIKPHSDKLLG